MFEKSKAKVFLNKSWLRTDTIDLRVLFVSQDEFGNKQAFEATGFEKSERDAFGSMSSEPLMVLSATESQRLMDQLWDCGVRPTEGAGSAGSLAATQSHLEDMRRIAFSQLGLNQERV